MTAIRKLSLLILLLLGTTYAGAEEIASIPLQDDDILSPSSSPTEKPSTPSLNNAPTTAPTLKPTDTPTFNPAAAPSEQPTDELSTKPTSPPSKAQLPDLPEALEGAPSATPTEKPSSMPSVYSEPSTFPSEIPTAEPSLGPSQVPSVGPSNLPSAQPSLRPSLSQAPSIVLSESPSNTPSTLPSKMPSQTPSDIPSDIPSATPTSAPSSQPTALPSSTPSATPSFKPSDTPSLVPTASPSVIPSLEPSQREQEALELQTDSPSTKPAYSPPKTASPTTSLFKSNGQYETIISVEIDGLKTILDEAEEIILENTILRFLSDKILDIQGISIFFLKTKLLRQTLVKNNRKLSSEKTFIMDVQVQAITVGGEIDPAIYHDVVQSTITENSDQFYARLQTISESFSGRVAAGQSGQEANEASPKNEDGMSMVIITAILVSTAIFVVGLLVACFAAYSRNKRRADKYERQIERVMSSMKSRASKSFKNDGTFTIGIPDEIQSINRSHSAPLSPDIEKNFPKRFSETSEASYDGGHNYKAEYCSDYPTDENEGMEEVELVEIAEEDASVAQVAAITGGSDRVQTVSILENHTKPTPFCFVRLS